METIELNRRWFLGDRIDGGGFGQIYQGESNDGSSVVIKLVPKAPGADRELLLEPLSGLPNIVPILDSGEWQDFIALVMPRAEMSLRRHLDDAGGMLEVDEVVSILKEVATALAALDKDVVHRDIKPENILLLKGSWSLADFGIARYADATTAPDTHKFSMSPPYASPEQWREERATPATDIYALGVMAYELIEGARPFPGPSAADYRRQHLNEAPPPTRRVPPTLSSLITECMYKPAAARPTAANLLRRLESSQAASSAAAAKLQDVNRAVVEKRSADEAKQSAVQSREASRSELLDVAIQSFTRIMQTLEERVLDAAPATSSEVGSGPRGRAARTFMLLGLAEGSLIVDVPERAPADCLAAFDYLAPFDVIAFSAIAARKPRDRYGYEGRAHSLWFCDAQEEGIYRWHELAFMVQPMIPERFTLDPFSLKPTDQDAGECLTPVMTTRQVAWQPLPFDQGDEGQFIERWVEWFAQAAAGTLGHPSTMPENSGGKYRFSQQRKR